MSGEQEHEEGGGEEEEGDEEGEEEKDEEEGEGEGGRGAKEGEEEWWLEVREEGEEEGVGQNWEEEEEGEGGGDLEEDGEEEPQQEEVEKEGGENEDLEKDEEAGDEQDEEDEEEGSRFDRVEAKRALEKFDSPAALSDRFLGGQNTIPPIIESGTAFITDSGRSEVVAASDGKLDYQAEGRDGSRMQSAGDGATRISAAGGRETRTVDSVCADAETDSARNCGDSNIVRQKRATRGTDPAESRSIIYSVVIPWDGQQQ